MLLNIVDYTDYLTQIRFYADCFGSFYLPNDWSDGLLGVAARKAQVEHPYEATQLQLECVADYLRQRWLAIDPWERNERLLAFSIMNRLKLKWYHPKLEPLRFNPSQAVKVLTELDRRLKDACAA